MSDGRGRQLHLCGARGACRLESVVHAAAFTCNNPSRGWQDELLVCFCAPCGAALTRSCMPIKPRPQKLCIVDFFTGWNTDLYIIIHVRSSIQRFWLQYIVGTRLAHAAPLQLRGNTYTFNAAVYRKGSGSWMKDWSIPQGGVRARCCRRSISTQITV